MKIISFCSAGLSTAVSTSPAMSTAAFLFLFVTSMTLYINYRSRKLNLPVIGTAGTNFDTEQLLEGVKKVGILKSTVYIPD